MRVRAKRIRLTIAAALVLNLGSACTTSQHYLATASIEAERYEAAAEHLRKCAGEGDKRCDYLIARLMLSGDIDSKPEEAIEWLRRAANAGLPAAQLDMGKLYESGDGLERDSAQAAEWFRKAADAGVSEAQAILGLLYAAGQGVEKDPALAVEWYRQAAERGSPLGQGALGAALFQGDGVEKNIVEGYMWTLLASEQHDDSAWSNLTAMAAQMTSEQRRDARRKASVWRVEEKETVSASSMMDMREKARRGAAARSVRRSQYP